MRALVFDNGILVAIENDYILKEADYVNYFIKHYEGEVIDLTRFGNRSKEEILQREIQFFREKYGDDYQQYL